MKPCGLNNNTTSVSPAEPFGSELKAELFTAEDYLKVDNFLAGEPFS
jgi:hypothetical protein